MCDGSLKLAALTKMASLSCRFDKKILNKLERLGMNKHTHIKLIMMAAAIFVAAIMQGCKHDKPTPIEPVEPAKASRTILVYMVATNNLGTGGFDDSDLREMAKAAEAGDLGDGRLVVYHASSKGVVLKEITAEGTDTLKVYDDGQVSVTIDRMREVINDTKELAPAKDYGMVLWSHASGWLQDGIVEESVPLRSFGQDGSVNSKKMNISSLAEATKDAELSFIYFDCCYMGSVEVAYEMRHSAPYMVMSPAEIPANGMPYDLNLKYLLNTEMTVEDALVAAATSTFNSYNDVFVKGDCPNTMAVIKTEGLDKLAEMTRQIYARATFTRAPETDYQKFSRQYTRYYYDYGQYVESLCTDEPLLGKWQEAMSGTVRYAAASPWIWSSYRVEHYSGLSTYILDNETSGAEKDYNTLQWYKDVASVLVE